MHASQVYDLGPALAHMSPNVYMRLVKLEGLDVTHLFESTAGGIHEIGSNPTCDAEGSSDLSRWIQHVSYLGELSAGKQSVKFVNLLSGSYLTVSVPIELSLTEVLERHILPLNGHLTSYKAKYLGKYLDESKTLSENGVLWGDEEHMRDLGIEFVEYIPTIYLHFIDDLTVG